MSFKRLLGERHDSMLEQVSLEKRVTESTPNTFLWHTFADGTVPVENSLLFANALRRADVKFELHIFPEGSHGLGLGSKETDTKDGKHYRPEVEVWADLFKTWVENTITAD
jgi:dipeptidyl aminopeptidase/acylaminoacyl peptidase